MSRAPPAIFGSSAFISSLLSPFSLSQPLRQRGRSGVEVFQGAGSYTSVSCVNPYEDVEEPVEVLGAGAGVTSVVSEDAAVLKVAA